MYGNHYDRKQLETAIIFARMYGVKETLDPLPFKPNDEIVMRITEWVKEYMNTGAEDIIQFFESRFQKGTTE